MKPLVLSGKIAFNKYLSHNPDPVYFSDLVPTRDLQFSLEGKYSSGTLILHTKDSDFWNRHDNFEIEIRAVDPPKTLTPSPIQERLL